MASIIKREGKRGVTYKAVIRRKGFATITRNFPTRKAAGDWARDTEGNHDRMTRLGGGGSRLMLSDAIEKTIAQHTGKDRSLPQRLAFWKERLGDWRLTQITRQTVAEELEELRNTPAARPPAKRRSPATVNRYLAALSVVFRTAQKAGLVEANPCQGIQCGGEVSRFRQALSDEERESLLKACTESEWDRLYLLVTMALSTGARLGELMSLTWADLDLKTAVAKLSDTKNGNPRHLPIIPSVLEQIKALPRPIDRTTHLFPSPINPRESYYNGFRPQWYAARRAAGIPEFRFHDLRHSAASYLTEAGVPLVTVAEILGHRTMSMVMRYSHVHTEQKARVVTEVFKDLLG